MAAEINDAVLWTIGGGGGVGGFIALGLWLRKQFLGWKMDEIGQKSIEASIGVNDKALANVRTEMERLGKRIEVLEKQVDELSTTLAGVRVVALDCYSLVISEQAIDPAVKQRLVEHLKTIIKDS